MYLITRLHVVTKEIGMSNQNQTVATARKQTSKESLFQNKIGDAANARRNVKES